jgi:hypothetical protein
MEKFLPISVQDFVQMITGNFVYVDKTRYIYEMARIPQAYYFLARPCRFGFLKFICKNSNPGKEGAKHAG